MSLLVAGRLGRQQRRERREDAPSHRREGHQSERRGRIVDKAHGRGAQNRYSKKERDGLRVA